MKLNKQKDVKKFKCLFILTVLSFFQLREADGDLDESSRVVSAMLRHAQQRRFIVTVVVAIVVIIIIVCIYVVLTRH